MSDDPQGLRRQTGSPRGEILILLLSAAALFTANMEQPGLPALDDCHYARKGVELGRAGGFYTVTWGGGVTTQHPPLQFFVLGRSFAALGENDLAARLPSAVMALAILLGVYRVGLALFSRPTAATATALLLASPYFVSNARRCMLDVPLAFWVLLCLLAWIEGQRRAWVLAFMGVPLAAAILTKSVLGLLPLLVLLSAAPFSPSLRRRLRSPWCWIGIAGGLATGASWILHQWLRIGPSALSIHLGREVVGRSLAPLGLLRWFTDYPKILLESYEPVAPLAAAGAFLLVRRWVRERDDTGMLIACWAFVPVVAYSLSAARTPRYLFPTFPALALCAGHFLTSVWPRAAEILRRWLIPLAALTAAAICWAQPALFQQGGTLTFKNQRRLFLERVPGGEPVTYLGSNYWGLANPLLYYGEAMLDDSSASAEQAVVSACSRRSALLVADRDRWDRLVPVLGEERVLLEDGAWFLLDLGGLTSRRAGMRLKKQSLPGSPDLERKARLKRRLSRDPDSRHERRRSRWLRRNQVGTARRPQPESSP